MPIITKVETRCLALMYRDWYGGEDKIPYHVLWPIPHAQVLPRDGAYATLVMIYDDEGRVGVGECGSTMAPQVTAEIVNRLLSRVLIGKNPLDLEVIWQQLYKIGRLNGNNRGFNMEAISGVDIALWDLAGKILDLPVYQLMGGAFQRSLKTYASPVPIMEDDRAAVRQAEEFAAAGFDGIKIKIGREDLQRDAALVGSIRSVVGPNVNLMVDANGAYSQFSAIEMGQLLEPLHIAWFEEPFSPDDVEAYAALRRNVRIPLAAGEGEATAYNFTQLIDRRLVDVIQPNVCRCGGLSAMRRIASAADAHHLPVSPHGVGGAVFLAATLHLCAAIPNFLSVEYNRRPNPLRDNLTRQPFHFENGCLHLPEGAGLGIQLDEDFLNRWIVY